VTWVKVHGVSGLEPWDVQVHLTDLPDGNRVVTGLQLNPHMGYPVSEQKLTRSRFLSIRIGEVKERALKTLYRLRPLPVIPVPRDSTRLQEAAHLYLEAGRLGKPPRAFVARRMGVSKTTVDRLFREARKAGVLAAYSGSQGKWGT
jgi:hypothetical protein